MTTTALVGASDFNAELFRHMDAQGAFDHVIAVDGGLMHLESIDRVPDMALGDFDSLGYVPKGMRVVRFSSHKDKSDMELAFERARQMHSDSIIVFGGLGRRLDHTLANIALFAAFSELGIEVSAIDCGYGVRMITGPDMFEMPAQQSGTVSVFSMNDEAQGVFERGLEWELDDATLTNRTSLGLSNEFKGEAVLVGVEEGTIAVIFPL